MTAENRPPAAGYEIDTARRLVIFRGPPPASFEEWKAVMDLALADPRYAHGFNLLSDRLTPGEAPTTVTVNAVADYLNSRLLTLSGACWAIVTKDPLHYGMVRMLSSMAAPARIAIRAFDDFGPALAWLEAPVVRKE